MLCNMETLCRKQVINICNGNRVGYVYDISFDSQTACICELIIEPDSVFSWKAAQRKLVIPWNCIRVIGDETILVQCEAPPQVCENKKHKFFGRKT